MKYERIFLGQVIIREKSKAFELPLVSSNSLKDLVRKSKITGTAAENMDVYIFSWVSLLKRPICTYYSSSRKKGFSFEPIIDAGSFLLITTKRQCRFFYQLYIPIIFNAKSHNFKLLPLEGIFVGSFFVFTKLRKKLHVDLAQVNNTEKALLRYLLAI